MHNNIYERHQYEYDTPFHFDTEQPHGTFKFQERITNDVFWFHGDRRDESPCYNTQRNDSRFYLNYERLEHSFEPPRIRSSQYDESFFSSERTDESVRRDSQVSVSSYGSDRLTNSSFSLDEQIHELSFSTDTEKITEDELYELAKIFQSVTLQCLNFEIPLRTNLNSAFLHILLKRQSHHWSDVGPVVKFNRLDTKEFEFEQVEYLFKDTGKASINIVYVERIENPFLLAAYLLKKEELTRRYGKEPEERLLFHGTKNRNVMGICKENFDWRRYAENGNMKFGRGVSFTPISYYATHYCDKHSNYKVMILTMVLQGESAIGTPEVSYPPPGCDTTSSPNNQVIVKYEDNEFYPLYKIVYHTSRKYRPYLHMQ